jgi:hypothetical protein
VLARRLVITAAHVIEEAGQPSVQVPGRPGRPERLHGRSGFVRIWPKRTPAVSRQTSKSSLSLYESLKG